MTGPLIAIAAILWCAAALWIAAERGWLEPYAPIVDFLDRTFGDIWDGIKRVLLPKRQPVAMRAPSPEGELAGLRLKVAFGGCAHGDPEPVENVDGDLVAWLCPPCDQALPADWK